MATTSFPLPPLLTYSGSQPAPELITQGAEGRLYKACYLAASTPCAVKFRPPKPYRHPTLDQRLTRHRILSEARALARCRRDGVAVPAVLAVDEAAGLLLLEWIPGVPVRVAINRFLTETAAGRGAVRAEIAAARAEGSAAPAGAATSVDTEGLEPLRALLRRLGQAVGALHKIGVIHGDLTTSNMMLRGDEAAAAELEGDVVIIDFGLASQSLQEEDRAVDLYVLERAFGSTHPAADRLFAVALEAYRETYRAAPGVLKKLDEVRMRGRKRSMLG